MVVHQKTSVDVGMQTGDNIVTHVENLPFKHVTYAIEVAAEHGIDVWPYLVSAGLAQSARSGTVNEVSRKDY